MYLDMYQLNEEPCAIRTKCGGVTRYNYYRPYFGEYNLELSIERVLRKPSSAIGYVISYSKLNME